MLDPIQTLSVANDVLTTIVHGTTAVAKRTSETFAEALAGLAGDEQSAAGEANPTIQMEASAGDITSSQQRQSLVDRLKQWLADSSMVPPTSVELQSDGTIRLPADHNHAAAIEDAAAADPTLQRDLLAILNRGSIQTPIGLALTADDGPANILKHFGGLPSDDAETHPGGYANW